LCVCWVYEILFVMFSCAAAAAAAKIADLLFFKDLLLVDELWLSGEVVDPLEVGVSWGQLEALPDGWESGGGGGGGSSVDDGGAEEDGPLLTAGGLIESSLELGLGGSDLGGVLDWEGSDTGVDGGDGEDGGGGDGGDWQVGGAGHAESQAVGDVVGPLELAVGINPAVGADAAAVGVALLVPGRVQVAVAESQVAELILSVELLGVGDSGGGHHGGSVGEEWGGSGQGSGSSDGGGGGDGGTSDVSASGQRSAVDDGGAVEDNSGVGGGSQGGNDSDKGLHYDDLMRLFSVRS